MRRTLLIFPYLFLSLVSLQAENEETIFNSYEPIIKSSEWKTGKYWPQRKIGYKDFYCAEHGNYSRFIPERKKAISQTGLIDKLTPGFWSLQYFDPEEYKKATAQQKEMVDDFLKNKWPMQTITRCSSHGNPMPTQASIDVLGDQWIGDGMPEDIIYRLEHLLLYLREKKIWHGYFKKDVLIDFYEKQLLPKLKEAVPQCQYPNHKWTRKELRTACDIYCDEYFKKIGKPIAWGMFLSPYSMAAQPQNVCVAEKGGDAFRMARARGVMRQNGGNKFLYVWRGHEPTEKYAYFDHQTLSLFSRPERDDQGYPLPHIWYYIFRPYLCGANMMSVEKFPNSLTQNIEEDGNWQLSTLGYITKAMLDFAERHPDRGTIYTPIALLLGHDRDIPITNFAGATYRGYDLPFDDADHMNEGLMLDLIFPEHRHVRNTGEYSNTAPYGEIFDLLSPNPDKTIDPLIFDGYKVLFALGGLEMTQAYADALKKYVTQGGILVLNVEDTDKNLPPDFFGVDVLSKISTGHKVKNLISGRTFDEKDFSFYDLKVKDAEVLYTVDGKALVTRKKVGKGYAILVGSSYMIQNEQETAFTGRWKWKWQKKPLLKFVDDFIEHLTAGLTPFDVRVRQEDKEDISWIVSKKGDGWTIAVLDYSVKREELIANSVRTACAWADYPYKSIPFEIVCRAPMTDVMELYEDRDVNYEKANGNIAVKENIRGGDIRIYEFQPHKIKLSARNRYKNYALNKPVKVSSELKGYSPRAAVDGNLDNHDFWQSGGDKRNYNFAAFPQWIEVDLQNTELINHIFVLFHVRKENSPELRQTIYKYIVELSEDGKKWITAIDESKNEDPANSEGLERWFEPVKARYIKLTVFRNTAYSGAQLVELQVMGTEKEKFQPARKSIIPKWQVNFPDEIKNVSEKKKKYLIRINPETVKPGWMPPGKKWKEMNGWVKLYTDNTEQGAVFTKSLYGESVFEAVYDIPPDAVKFVSAIGLGCKSREASVEFKVFVDGNEKFNSGLYRFGMPVLPVIVDTSGAKKLKLIVTDAGDGIASDYAWWGDARFILK